MADRYLRATAILDYDHPGIRDLVAKRGWARLPQGDRIGAIYEFVRDEIEFGFSASDEKPASEVLADGYGQCNTKAALLMALLRATGTPCRLHGATVDKELQRGYTGNAIHHIVPKSVTHCWAEVLHNGRWISLEGVILDRELIAGVRRHLQLESGPFLGYAIGTDDVAHPPIEWVGKDTFIQSTGVDQDFGVFDDPDEFYRLHRSTAHGVRGWLFRHRTQRVMNQRVAALRHAPRHARTEVAA
jgi:hypothetical protein